MIFYLYFFLQLKVERLRKSLEVYKNTVKEKVVNKLNIRIN